MKLANDKSLEAVHTHTHTSISSWLKKASFVCYTQTLKNVNGSYMQLYNCV